MDLASLLQKTLQAPLKLMITQCCISELYATKEQAPIALAKTCERRRCGHIPEPVSSHKCITECVNISGENKHRYILATQDAQLRAEMRQIPGVPMIYIKRAVMVMEPTSPATLNKRNALERGKLGGMERLGKRKQRDEDDEDKPKKKKKGAKEPNPLSIKKKKKPTSETNLMTEHRGVTSTGNEGGNEAEVESNIIGEVTDSVRRQKSTRKRKHHKKPAQQEEKEEKIPTETEAPE